MPIEIKREELYEKVWAQPLTRIAKEYGISDVAVKKICNKLSVPVPPQGHWRKLEVGMKTKIIPLPPPGKDTKLVHTIADKHENIEKVELNKTDIIKINKENETESKIIVNNNTNAFEKIVIKTMKSMKKSYRYEEFMHNTGDDTLKLFVSKSQLNRALAIYDALIKALLNRGCAIHVEKEATYVAIGDEKIRIVLKEKLKRVKNEFKKDSWSGDYCFISSGILRLSIDEYYRSAPIRKNIKDSKTGPLENKLNEFIKALVIASKASKITRIYKLEQNKKYELEQLRRRRQLLLEEREKERGEVFEKLVDDWLRCMELRAYIEMYRSKYLRSGSNVKNQLYHKKWLNWAEKYVSKMDPFSRNSSQINDLATRKRNIYF